MPSKEPIPANLLIECEDPVLLEGDTGKDIMKNQTINGELWKECRTNNHKLIEAVKATQK